MSATAPNPTVEEAQVVDSNGLPAAQRAYLALHEQIVSLERPPGSRLSEVAIAEQLGMSRTPVREALRRLEAEGLVLIEEGRATVAAIDADTIVEQYQLREALETYAFVFVTRSPYRSELVPIADEIAAVIEAGHFEREAIFPFVDRIFEIVQRATGNGLLVRYVKQLRMHARRPHELVADPRARLEQETRQYLDVLRAVIAGDEQAVARLVHIRLETAMTASLATIHAQAPRLLAPLAS